MCCITIYLTTHALIQTCKNEIIGFFKRNLAAVAGIAAVFAAFQVCIVGVCYSHSSYYTYAIPPPVFIIPADSSSGIGLFAVLFNKRRWYSTQAAYHRLITFLWHALCAWVTL